MRVMKLLTGACVVVAGANALVKKSPVSKVVGLLEDLRTKSEDAGKTDEKSFSKYKCWYDKTKKEFEAYNEKATEELVTKKQYLSDLEKGYVELTPERANNEKAKNAVMKELQLLRATEDKRVQAHDENLTNLDKGLGAMDTALDVLKKGAGSKAMLMVKGVSIKKVVMMGDAVLSATEAADLRHNLGEASRKPDYEKLNDKSSLNKYSADASSTIIKLVEKMYKQFSKNKTTAEKEAAEALVEFENLQGEKEKELAQYDQALLDGSAESGAKAKKTAEIQEEIDSIEKKVADNKDWLQTAGEEYTKSREIFDARVANRTAEIAAIGKAIGILHSDDARDMFKDSFESQGQFFLQTGSWKTNFHKFLHAIKDMRTRKIAIQTLSTMGNSAINQVITTIEDLLTVLDEDDAQDEATVKKCKEDLQTEYGNAKDQSVEADKNVDKMAAADAEIEEGEKIVEEVKESEEEREKSLKDRKELSRERLQGFKEEIADDQAASSLVGKALVVMRATFTGGAPDLVQVGAIQRHVQAPPKPELSYEGNETGDQSGGVNIVGILEMIQKDIDADRVDSEKERSEEMDEFSQFMKEDHKQKEDNAERRTNAETMVEDNREKRKAADESKDAALQLVDTAHSTIESIRANQGDGCDYFALNFEARKANRRLEREGLHDAITVLKSQVTPAP